MKQASSSIRIENSQCIVTEWSFLPGQETGHHVHEYDYLVIPLTEGELLAISDTQSTIHLQKGAPYFKKRGVSHNVVNNSDKKVAFLEIEIKEAGNKS